MRRIAAAVGAALGLGGCLPGVDLPPAAAAPAFDPVAFFAGPTRGSGTLTTLTGGRKAISVTSVGTPAPDGSLVLRQDITTEGDGTRQRTWTIHPLGGGRYTGTLTEAVGPVTAEVVGNRMTIRYKTKDYRVRQTLVLGADGRVANRLDVVKWGLNVARLGETIVPD